GLSEDEPEGVSTRGGRSGTGDVEASIGDGVVALEIAGGASGGVFDVVLAHWNGVARDIEKWLRPWRPFVIVSSILILVAILVAAMLGGMLPAPGWFAPVNDWFWSLPWP